MNAQDLMTADPVVADPTLPLAEVRSLMRECGFRTLPVIEDHGVVGIVTDAAAWGHQDADATAADVMTRPQVVVDVAEPLIDVLTRCTWSLQEAVLVQEAGRLVGILTEHDVVRLASELLPAEQTVEDYASTSLVTVDANRTVEHATKVAEQNYLRHLIVLIDGSLLGVVSVRDLRAANEHHLKVGELVQGPVQWTVSWQMPLRDAAAMMVRHHIGCLPVVDDDETATVSGVLSRTDLMRALMSTPAVLVPRESA